MPPHYPHTMSPQHGWDFSEWHPGEECSVSLISTPTGVWCFCRPCRCLVPLPNAGIRIDADLAYEPRSTLE